MSRPSATQSPWLRSSRCFWTSASRTSGFVATLDAASETSGCPDRLGYVLAVGEHPVAELDVQVRGMVGGRAAVPMCHEPDGPVHRARVQVGETERARGSARDRALARPRGPIDGHDHGGDRLRGAAPLRLGLIAQIAST